MTHEKIRALIVGGGFGGVKAALELADSDHYDVTLLSDSTHFRFFPALYHTATGGTVAESSISLQTIFEGKGVRVVQGEAVSLNRKAKTITTKDGRDYAYDVLVMALGSVPNYFGIPGIKELSFSIKTPEEAKRFKAHLHRQLMDEHKPDLNYVIVGGGPTGIELAGSLTGYLKEIMKLHDIKHRAIHVDLVEAAPKLVPRMPAAMSRSIARRLRKLGVKLYLGKAVQGETADQLMVDGKPIQSHTVVWSAGIANHPFFGANQFQFAERGKVAVDDYLQAEEDIFIIGDNANTMYSGMAQTALYDGIYLAENLKRRAIGLLMQRYKPKRPIYVIPVGPHWSAVLWGKVQIYGWMGWILRNAADIRAFGDYEPWVKAGRQWLTEFETENDCTTCTGQMSKIKL